jgi:hypothetical protein
LVRVRERELGRNLIGSVIPRLKYVGGKIARADMVISKHYLPKTKVDGGGGGEGRLWEGVGNERKKLKLRFPGPNPLPIAQVMDLPASKTLRAFSLNEVKRRYIFSQCTEHYQYKYLTSSPSPPAPLNKFCGNPVPDVLKKLEGR